MLGCIVKFVFLPGCWHQAAQAATSSCSKRWRDSLRTICRFRSAWKRCGSDVMRWRSAAKATGADCWGWTWHSKMAMTVNNFIPASIHHPVVFSVLHKCSPLVAAPRHLPLVPSFSCPAPCFFHAVCPCFFLGLHSQVMNYHQHHSVTSQGGILPPLRSGYVPFPCISFIYE